ncbi:hypothetical protein Q1695_006649 [Nippostrongylus brasiliensis]|nr:hypothetical protein Q1695_006649 [Nippostrongylus brasiliensis]
MEAAHPTSIFWPLLWRHQAKITLATAAYQLPTTTGDHEDRRSADTYAQALLKTRCWLQSVWVSQDN